MFDEINGDFIQWIRCFYYIAENRSMTLAARTMNRSQSTLSIQLKKLETLLNVPLFNRTNNTMILTEEGKKLYNKAITLLELVSDIQKLSDTSDTEIYGNISIACLNQIATCFLPDYISQFRKKYQKVSFTLNTGMHSMLTHLVSSNEVDFGVLAYNSNYAETLKFFHIFSTEMILVARKDLELDISSPITEEEFLRLPLLGFTENCQIHKNVDKFFEKKHCPFKPFIRVPYYDIMLKYISQGEGVGVMEKFIFDSIQPEGLVSYSLSAIFEEVKYGLLIREHKHLSPQAHAFLNFCFHREMEKLTSHLAAG